MFISRREILTCVVTVAGGCKAGRLIAKRGFVQPNGEGDLALASFVVLLALVDGEQRLIMIDPVEGKLRQIWATRQGAFRGANRVSNDRVIIAVAGSDIAETDVHGVQIGEEATQALGSVPGAASPAPFQPSAEHLVFLHYDEFLPVGVTWLDMPPKWAPQPPYRAENEEIVWLGRAEGTPEAVNMAIVRVSDADDRSIEWQEVGLGVSPYHSFLISSDGESIFIVDWSANEGTGQTITRVSAAHRQVRDRNVFWHERFKRPPSAAVLSPDNDRLFVLANRNNAGDGLKVFDATTLELTDHWFPREQLYQLSMSQDGQYLYALDYAGLSVIDVVGSELLHVIPLNAPPHAVQFVS